MGSRGTPMPMPTSGQMPRSSNNPANSAWHNDERLWPASKRTAAPVKQSLTATLRGGDGRFGSAGSVSCTDDEIPRRVGAAGCDAPSDSLLPIVLAPVFIAPGEQPAREMVQLMFVGEAHRAVYLMCHFCNDAGGLADARF